MATKPGPHSKDAKESNGKFPFKSEKENIKRPQKNFTNSSDEAHRTLKSLRVKSEGYSSNVEAGLKKQKAPR